MADAYMNFLVYPIYNTLGLSNQYLRFGFFDSIAGIVVYFYKPEIMFDAAGYMKPWAVVAPNASNKTYFPFFFVPLIFGTVGVLI